VAAWIHLFPQFGLANPHSTDYWSYSSYHLAAAECASPFLSVLSCESLRLKNIEADQ
jgi:hypothetical protein